MAVCLSHTWLASGVVVVVLVRYVCMYVRGSENESIPYLEPHYIVQYVIIFLVIPFFEAVAVV